MTKKYAKKKRDATALRVPPQLDKMELQVLNSDKKRRKMEDV